MPVDRRVFGEVIRHQDADAVALDRFDRGTGRLTVVTPGVDDHAGRQLALHLLRHEMEDLHTAVHDEGQRLPVRRHHRQIRQLALRTGKRGNEEHGRDSGADEGASHGLFSWARGAVSDPPAARSRSARAIQ